MASFFPLIASAFNLVIFAKNREFFLGVSCEKAFQSGITPLSLFLFYPLTLLQKDKNTLRHGSPELVEGLMARSVNGDGRHREIIIVSLVHAEPVEAQ
ncbi:MAG: hypothetical protein FP813_00445 [Desulfurivibrio sp.]|nr:hypothetical protein [Desulfurivibrio sp.]MBU4117451.1 hypothetical protein [Pseudomonadota bacterium]